MNTILKASASVAALLVLSSGSANAAICFLTGTSGDDTLTAVSMVSPPCNFRISGLAGDDVLTGNGGDDWLIPGTQSLVHSGHDTMTGNGGADIFFMDNVSTSLGLDANEITDFTHGTDKINVGPVCTAHSLTCVFIGGSAFSGVAGEVRYSATSGTGYGLLQIDLDGGGSSDYDVKLDGAPTVTSDDIIDELPPLGSRFKKSSK